MTKFNWWIIEQKTHFEMLEILREQLEIRPWASYFLRDPPLSPGNLSSKCRIEYVPFDDCIQDRYFHIDEARKPESLAAGGITTQIYWDHNPKNLPEGWQGAVRQSYSDTKSKQITPNTQVALLAFTTQRYRGQGQAAKVLTKMCLTAKRRGYRYCIVPALPPSQFEKEYVQASMTDLANLKRKDGQLYDYWLRLHTRMGAKVIGHCSRSHRFVFSLDDFSRFVSSDQIRTSGEHIVRLDKDRTLGPNNQNMWQIVYADLERRFVVFDWGCVWVQYDLKELKFE